MRNFVIGAFALAVLAVSVLALGAAAINAARAQEQVQAQAQDQIQAQDQVTAPPTQRGTEPEPVETGDSLDSALPRYFSLRNELTYVRVAPDLSRPVLFVYARARYPVLALLQYENWYRIRDFQGDEGWVRAANLSRRRTAIVQVEDTLLFSEPGFTAQKRARLVYGVVVRPLNCEPHWCKVRLIAEGHEGLPDDAPLEGWLPREVLWGLHPGENVARSRVLSPN